MDKQQIREQIAAKEKELRKVEQRLVEAEADKRAFEANKFMYQPTVFHSEVMFYRKQVDIHRANKRAINRAITRLQHLLGDINERERAERQRDFNAQFVITARNILDDKTYDSIIRLTSKVVQQHES